ncbi:hypothetical protein ABPG77_008088 [Micractinium sp. CCAP 211/92]
MAMASALRRPAVDAVPGLLHALARTCSGASSLWGADVAAGTGSWSRALTTSAPAAAATGGRLRPGRAVPGAGQAAGTKLGIPGVQHIITVASGKGGVGKSTTAVNLAVALAQRLGLRVGLLDADVYGPSCHRMMRVAGKPRVDEEEKMIPARNYGVSVMSMGLLMGEDVAAVWRGPMVMSALETFMRRVRWAPLDVLVIDMPPGTGDAQLSISQRLRLSGAVIVTTPQDIALLDARRGCTMFRQVNVPILGIVENMSWFICGNCGHESHPFGSGGAEKAAADMEMELLGKIPLNILIREAADEGTPIVAGQPGSAAAQAYASVAERVWSKLQAAGGGEQQPRGPPSIVFET